MSFFRSLFLSPESFLPHISTVKCRLAQAKAALAGSAAEDRREKEKAAAAAAAAPPLSAAESREKKTKALQKKLKQVAELKAKRAAGTELNADQTSKLTGEAGLLEELRALGV